MTCVLSRNPFLKVSFRRFGFGKTLGGVVLQDNAGLIFGIV